VLDRAFASGAARLKPTEVPPSSPSLPEVDLPKAIGRYEVVRLVGEGAMGRVLLAHDPVLGRDVAVKLLRSDLRVPRDVRQGLFVRMRHEARAAARVAHPHIVTLHDMGEDEQHGLYLVFEYVEGPTLKQRLLKGRLPPEQAARLARDLGAALTVAHKAGVLHRDVKPDNIILAKIGGKIADFGIAKVPDSTLTQTGGLMGTPAYSAPETLRGSHFSAESDQFSLAASLYEALSGERAFKGDDAVEVALRISQDSPEPFAQRLDLPAGVDGILSRAMAKDPAARFSSCEAFGDALATLLTGGEHARQKASEVAGHTDPRAAVQTGRTGPPADARPERKTTHVLLGGAVVVATAALLVRTALRSAAQTETDAPMPTASASGALPPDLRRPKPGLPAPRPRPRPDNADTSTDKPVASAPAAPPARDAGTDARSDVGSAAPAPSAATAAPAPSSSAPSNTGAPP
jgi:serine/threonine-protein kinase